MMTTGEGIVLAMMMYLCWQGFMVWLVAERAVRRPAVTEARLSRIEKLLREWGVDL